MSEIIQVAFRVSSKIRAGLNSGLYVQIGGVIRNAASGAIVKHLVPVFPNDKTRAFRLAVDAGKRIPKFGVIVIVAVAAGAGLVAITYKIYRAPIVKCVEEYQVALSEYLKAISKGKLVPEKLSRLISVFDNMKVLAKKKRFAWVFPDGMLENLHDILKRYTEELAKANKFTLPNNSVSQDHDGDRLVAEIEQFLMSQNGILGDPKA